MDIKIRPAAKDDAPKIISILNDAFNSPLNLPDDNEYIEDPNILTFVGESRGDIIGTASLHIIKKINRKIGLIEDVAVYKRYKGKGIGKLFLIHLVELAKLKGAYKTILNSTIKNEIFYHKIGFKTEQIQLVKRY
jgi:N-acetylglutamate synthase-like GNAT family acetyltransferase